MPISAPKPCKPLGNAAFWPQKPEIASSCPSFVAGIGGRSCPIMKETDEMKTLFVTIALAIASLSLSQEAFAMSCTTSCYGNQCYTNCN